ncbi:amidohydrolase [Microbacterium natoriense]|uniref:Amidohydrolase n=1 Tax=Microbacterium natoriense TaxID=284570 RepID=A0AAW8EUB3_9MICO|nr:M20 family metallopeptidase [Microbacterium natoriense]MDQ0647066.1 amidohydrolase [Microbacterium natoriense]
MTGTAIAASLLEDLRMDSQALLPDLVELRRALHQDPETGIDLPRTQQRLLDALSGLPLEITLGRDLSSIVAVLRGGKPGPVVLLRGDMDGLPLVEETGLPYSSTGAAMHACGHDLHMAGLVGAAKLLSARQDELPGSVIFMFQPGEEVLQGAKMMLDEGLLEAAGERPVAAYGIHVSPGPSGHFGLAPGASTAGSNTVSITVHGEGGHGSRPFEAIDPVPILAEIILAAQSLVTRQMDAQDPIILTLTTLRAGSARNVIPAEATAEGTLRNLSTAALERVKQRLSRLVPAIAEAHGATASVEITEGCPPLVNDDHLTTQSADVLSEMFGADRVTKLDAATAVMGSEDFAFVSNEVPSSFFRLLATPADLAPDAVSYNHSPFVQFDDGVLGDQAAALAALAFDRLRSHG